MTIAATSRAVRIAAAIALVACALGASAQDVAATTAQRIAREWLAITDRGDGGASWDAAAKLFRDAITRERWSESLTAVRSPLGAVEQRTVLSTSFEKSFPGAPQGDYAIVLFRTAFAKRADSQETVTLAREQDGAWRVVGYFIH